MEGVLGDEDIQAAIAEKHRRAEIIGAERAKKSVAERPQFSDPRQFGATILTSSRVEHARELITKSNPLDDIDRILAANQVVFSHALDQMSWSYFKQLGFNFQESKALRGQPVNIPRE